MGIYESNIELTILGAIFMKNKDVIFDNTNYRIGFAPSRCDPRDITGETLPHIVDPATSVHSDSYKYYKLIGAGIGAVLVIAVILRVYRKRRFRVLEEE